MSNITIKKDSSTEFLRLIACLIVIGVHVKLGNIIDGRIIFSHIYIYRVFCQMELLFFG